MLLGLTGGGMAASIGVEEIHTAQHSLARTRGAMTVDAPRRSEKLPAATPPLGVTVTSPRPTVTPTKIVGSGVFFLQGNVKSPEMALRGAAKIQSSTPLDSPGGRGALARGGATRATSARHDLPLISIRSIHLPNRSGTRSGGAASTVRAARAVLVVGVLVRL